MRLEQCVSMMTLLGFSLLAGANSAAAEPASAKEIFAPQFLKAPIENESVPVLLPDGTIKIFFISRPEGTTMSSISSRDGGLSWSAPQDEFELPFAGYHAVQVLVERESGELVAFFHAYRGDPNGRKPGVDHFYDGWFTRTSDQRTKWSPSKRVFEGYIGALRSITQLKNGRIIVPFGCEVPGRGQALPSGSEIVTAMYSDDGGRDWHKLPSEISAPCDPEYNNAGFDGACEPSITQLGDGRVWILMRTQANFLYETFSEDGLHFQPARRSRFFSPNAPSFLLRLKDGRLLLFWNNTANPPKVTGKDVYGSRDVLHVAISSDDAKTWRGFRELYRDPLRDSAPPQRGDRGTSYACAAETKDGKIVVAAGLGEQRRRIILFDPNWVEETSAAEDFSKGLDGWSTFKWFGPVTGVWRDRTAGPALIDDPDAPTRKVLHVRRPDDNDPDGAVWNFPAGMSGEVTLRVKLQDGCRGGSIALADRFFDPTDVNGGSRAMFYTEFYPDGAYCAGKLSPAEWHDVTLKWNTIEQVCRVSIDGKPVMEVPELEPTRNGIGYLRLRSTAQKPDSAGFLVQSVAAKIETPE